MYQEAIELLEMENDLRKAIEREEFVIYYQPIISINTGKISGFEALLRWQHPTHGLVYPTNFIPVAEETGLINPINMWVLQSACQQLQIWQNHSTASQTLTMSVNLSAGLFYQPNFIAQIDNILCDTQVNPASLEIEITESVIMKNTDEIKIILQQLKDRKIKLIMDDFGTGYSSLSYLHMFPFDALKIDQSFVKLMQENKENMGLVPAMIGIATSMGMTAIAEGVETPEQLAQLKNLNCHFAQGYLFSQAISQKLVLELMQSSPQW
jgi:EAL domain-containing protein (putative c-di-GMP-specific phosphodiesterase class I)